ncbi:DsbA family protein [Patescibacteria group bacterium]|nr:DsbA family protein [Patescibacteria group bacterium]
MNNNTWFGISMGLVGVIVGFGVATAMDGGSFSLPGSKPEANAPAPTPSAPTPARSADDVPAVTDTDHVRGNLNAKVTVVEYSDFECPFCARHHPTMVQLLEDYGDDVNIVFRHYPLSFHSNAQKSAEASECANELGGNDAFWEYHDILFENGADVTQLVSYAEEVGLNKTAFETCLNSDKYAQHVKDDMNGGSKAGVSGTPGNIIIDNDTGETRLVSGAQPIENFKAVIDEML